MSSRRLLSPVLLAALAAGGSLAGCGDDEEPATSEKAAAKTPEPGAKSAVDPTGNTLDASSEPRDAKITIAMKDLTLKPALLTARPGQTLVFTNEDDVAHKIESVEGQSFASKRIGPGQTYVYKIKKVAPDVNGLAYTCTIHPLKMDGGIVLTLN